MIAYIVLALAVSSAIPAEATVNTLYPEFAAAAPSLCPMWANIKALLSGATQGLTVPSPFECPFLIKIAKPSPAESKIYSEPAAAAPAVCPFWANIKALSAGGKPKATPSPFECPFLINIVAKIGAHGKGEL